MTSKTSILKSFRSADNIQLLIHIGNYKLTMSIPKQTKVLNMMNIIRGYQKIHQQYGPLQSIFTGLATKSKNPIIDYYLTQSSLTLHSLHSPLELEALYTSTSILNEQVQEHMDINDFQFLLCLGKGACGNVYLVRSRRTKYIFALKRIHKECIKDFKSMQSIVRQKKILTILDNNVHTVKFHGCFESAEYFNFVMDYYAGGQMFIHLNRIKLDQKEIKIYFCQIVLAMQYLHNNNILYRDLKPENILIDLEGHLRIADFGLSKCGFHQQDNTKSICGSAQYMAPQILQNKMYNFAVDFYSLGAILYELLTGLPPYYSQHQNNEFYGENQDDIRLKAMKNMDLNLSSITENVHLKSLLNNLLNSDPQNRLCNFQQIKNSQWLIDINWKKIQEKKQILPFAPQLYSNYIGQQFLQLMNQVSQMNNQQDCTFELLFGDFFNYIKPTSKCILFNLCPSLRTNSNSTNSSNPITKNYHIIKENTNKRKTTGFIKDKTKILKSKQNISITLFDHDHSNNNIEQKKYQGNKNIKYIVEKQNHHNKKNWKKQKQNGKYMQFKQNNNNQYCQSILVNKNINQNKCNKNNVNTTTTTVLSNNNNNNINQHIPLNNNHSKSTIVLPKNINLTPKFYNNLKIIQQQQQLIHQNKCMISQQEISNKKQSKSKQNTFLTNMNKSNNNQINYNLHSQHNSNSKNNISNKSQSKQKNGKGIKLHTKQKLKKQLLPTNSYKIKLI